MQKTALKSDFFCCRNNLQIYYTHCNFQFKYQYEKLTQKPTLYFLNILFCLSKKFQNKLYKICIKLLNQKRTKNEKNQFFISPYGNETKRIAKIWCKLISYEFKLIRKATILCQTN